MIYKNGERMRDFLGLMFLLLYSFLYFGSVFNKTIIPFAPRWLSIISNPTRAHGIIVKYTTNFYMMAQ